MIEKFLAIPNMDSYLVLGVLIFFVCLELFAGYAQKTHRSISDWIQEAGSFFVLSLLIKPGIVLLVILLGNIILPSASTTLSMSSLIWILPVYLLVDDLLQYIYHRAAHEHAFLWKLHRPHHQAEEMGFFVSYRNSALYYLLMPNIWWIAIFTFLGGGLAVAIGLILKQLVIISSHSTLHYDQILYKYKVLQPLAYVYERIIITPAFHHAHHGKSKLDGISDPNGNFGNMFSIWDQLFGTAIFTRQVPVEFGLQNDPKEKWTVSYLYPFISSSNPKSELHKTFKKTDQRKDEPSLHAFKKGDKFLWCQCGLSQNQPFCDGSHHGSKFKPLLHKTKRDGKASLCNCKKTKNGPFCDGSHSSL